MLLVIITAIVNATLDIMRLPYSRVYFILKFTIHMKEYVCVWVFSWVVKGLIIHHHICKRTNNTIYLKYICRLRLYYFQFDLPMQWNNHVPQKTTQLNQCTLYKMFRHQLVSIHDSCFMFTACWFVLNSIISSLAIMLLIFRQSSSVNWK